MPRKPELKKRKEKSNFMLTSFALGQIYMPHISAQCKHTHTHIHTLSLSPPYSLRIITHTPSCHHLWQKMTVRKQERQGTLMAGEQNSQILLFNGVSTKVITNDMSTKNNAISP